jgi:hypothetical protein
MSGHTPGPWHWGKGWNGPHNLNDSHDCEKYADMILMNDKGEVILPLIIDHYQAEWDCDNRCEPPMAADRALIEAAPDLLRELKNLVNLLGTVEAYMTSTIPGFAAFNGAHAAIAKAEGRNDK